MRMKGNWGCEWTNEKEYDDERSSVQSHQQPCSLGFTDRDDDNDDTSDDWEGEYDPEDENENHNDDEDEKINDDSQRVIVVLIHNQWTRWGCWRNGLKLRWASLVPQPTCCWKAKWGPCLCCVRNYTKGHYIRTTERHYLFEYLLFFKLTRSQSAKSCISVLIQ